jgi:tetratricopeptide (TPR) repeat protein
MHKFQDVHIVFILLGLLILVDPVFALSASELITQGNDFYTSGDYIHALGSYNGSIALDDQNNLAWYNRGNVYSALGDVENAYQSYLRAAELNPNNALAWNGIGNSLTLMKRYNESVDAYNRAIAISPEIKYPYFGKGNALLAQNNYSDALNAYNQSILRDPNYSIAWNGKGNVLSQTGRYCDARDSYQKALELSPNYEAARINIVKAEEKCTGSTQSITGTQTKPATFSPLILISIPTLLFIGVGGYYFLHSRKPPVKSSPALIELPRQIPIPSSILLHPSMDSVLKVDSLALQDLIKEKDKNSTALTHYRAPVDNLLTLSQQLYNSSNYDEAEHVLKKAEADTDSLKHCESRLSDWKILGYDTTVLENFRSVDAFQILSKFQEFEEGIGRLERVKNSLEAIKKDYPLIVTQEEFPARVAAIEICLKKPDCVDAAESGLQQLKLHIKDHLELKGRLRQYLLDQARIVMLAVTDTSVLDETNRIVSLLQNKEISTANTLFQKMVSRHILQVQETIASLRNDGAVIPGSISIEQKADDNAYGDILVKTSGIMGELDRLKTQFAEATTLKNNISDTELIELFNAGKYKQFIEEHKKKQSEKIQELIFISSKSADYQQVVKLYDFLISHKRNVFFSQESLPQMGNADYREEIDKAIDQAKHMIVVGSSVENILSPWVKDEWGAFVIEKRSGRKPGSNLITLIIGSVKIDELPISLRMNEVIPFDTEKFSAILNYLN